MTQTGNFFDRDCSSNPVFCDYNLVYVPYCTGDVHSGQQRAFPSPALPFYFSGHLNIVTIVDHLLNTTSLGSAQRVMVSGSSAGGLGTFVNVDYIASRLPASTNVMGNPQGGYFFPAVVPYPEFTAGFFGPPFAGQNATVFTDIFNAYGNAECIDAHGPAYCASVFGWYPYIKTPLFITENAADSNQIFVELEAPMANTTTVNAFVQYFAQAMRANLTSQVAAKPGDGLFVPGCLAHTENTAFQSTGTLIKGVSIQAALSHWYTGQGNAPTRLMDACTTIPCNPTCPPVGRLGLGAHHDALLEGGIRW